MEFESLVSGQHSPCWLGVPLNSQNGTIGALIVKSKPGDERYTEQDKELLQYVCAQVATAIERKQLHTRLQHMAQYDQLTQLPNRELLRDRLKLALASALEERGRMALLYVDLDRFKQVNDTHGHAVGDMLLQTVANRLKGCVRETDTVARIGGDEFAIILRASNGEKAATDLAHSICRLFETPFIIKGLSNAPIKKLMLVDGGANPSGDVCAGQHWHGFIGMEREAVDQIAGWIKAPAN